MAISIQDGLTNLWNSTGIVNFVLPADPTIQNSVEQFLHMYGQILMVFICLFLLWLGIKKQFEPLLLVPIAFGGLIANFPCDHGFQQFVYKVGIDPAIGIFPLKGQQGRYMVNKGFFLSCPIFPYIINKRFFDFILFSV